MTRACSVLLALALFLSHARAEDVVPAAAPTELAPGKMLAVEGVRGRWWPLSTALVLMREHEEIGALRALSAQKGVLAATLEDQLAERDVRIKLLQQADATSQHQAKVATDALDQTARKIEHVIQVAEREKEARERWYRQPAFWFCVGAVATAALTIAVVRGTH